MNREDRPKEYKERVTSTFNLVAPGYDSEPLRFFSFCADRLVERLKISRGDKVLDVATGTGAVAVAAAQRVGSEGRVIGVDLAEAMLERAHAKVRALGLENVDLHVMDAEALEFRGKYFDAVACSFGIFFLADMLAGFREWRRVLKPGGRIMFTCFGRSAFQPLTDLFLQRMEGYGVVVAKDGPRTAAQRLTEPDDCRSLLADAGLEGLSVETRQLGYHLRGADEWWDVVWNAGFRAFLTQLSAVDRKKFKTEHLAEVGGLASEKGIWLDVETIFAMGCRPLSVKRSSPVRLKSCAK